MPVTIRDIRAYKERSERIPMVTAYDAPSARLVDEAGIPLILVGDSLAMVVLGYPSTVHVTMEEMLHHTAAVARGSSEALIVADLPFMSYQASLEDGMRNAGRFLKEAGAHAVKLEGGGPAVTELVERLTSSGVPVMGHLGLTPQSVNQLGGYRVQGRTEEAAHLLEADAKELESAGAFAVVLEAVPAPVAARVTAALEIPTIGIGAGSACDGQVLVWHDLLGITPKAPRFVKRYGTVGEQTVDALKRFAADVSSGGFPGEEHTYQ